MRRIALLLLAAAAIAGCVSVEGLPNPRGALKPGQRLVVLVNQAPGPWLVDGADSKAEAAAKISPLGFMVQSVQDQHVLSVSKEIQQYLPRPHYALEVRDALLKSLHVALSSGAVQTGAEAGLSTAQLLEWNKASDQLDWRQRYYFADPDQPAPRDYSKILSLDDALILDVNVSFGTTADEAGKLMPQISAASRVYRGDTTRLIWSHEDEFTDASSTYSLAEFELQPAELTGRIEKMAPNLGTAVAVSFTKAFGLAPSTSAPAGIAGAPAGGLVPMSFFQQNASTAPAPGAWVLPTTSSAAAPTTPPAAVVVSSGMSASGVIPVSSAPAVSTETAPAPGAPAPR